MILPRRLEIARTATIAMVVLAAAASLAGAFVPGVYAEDVLAAAMRGQDIATLIALPLLMLALHRMNGGSPRATVVWIGLLGYLLYTYAGGAFAYPFNRLFPVYVALFSFSVFASWASHRPEDLRNPSFELGGPHARTRTVGD